MYKPLKSIGVLATTAMLFVLGGAVALASGVDVAVVDVTSPTDAVSLAPGGTASIKIDMSVTGNQIGNATFEVYRDWTLSGGTFTGSNPQEFAVAPRGAGDPATTFSTAGTVTIAAGQAAGGPFVLKVGAFDITNTNSTGAKLAAGESSSYSVTVEAPAKAATSTTVTCPDGPFYYTGSAIEPPCTASVTGPAGLSQSLTVSYINNVNAGLATASASYAGNANYEASSSSDTFTINKAATITTVTCSDGPLYYTGSAFEPPCTASVTGPGGLSQSLTVSYTNNVNAGLATASASYAGNANYEASNGSDTFTINKAATSTTVTCAAGPFYYTGVPITPCSATVTGPGGLSQPLTVEYSNNVKDGTASASASYAGTANYEQSSDSETFTIVGWTLGGFYQPVDMNGALNIVKAGSTVPLKFEVSDQSSELTDVAVVDTFKWGEVSCSAYVGAAMDDIEQYTSGQTVLRYDTTGGQFIQNWQTPKKAGSCYKVTMTTDSGTFISALFKLK